MSFCVVAWLPNHSLVLVFCDKTLQPKAGCELFIFFLLESFNLSWNRSLSPGLLIATSFYPAF
jgi:hypothetical protein